MLSLADRGGVLQFVYLKESFCPSLDEKVAVLYEVAFLSHRAPAAAACHVLNTASSDILQVLSLLQLYCIQEGG